ncbi:MAG: CPBP family intramembrane glutamic endopeptidase [Cyanophyceae cyanobacterium]
MADSSDNTATASGPEEALNSQPRSLLGKYLAFLRSPVLTTSSQPQSLPQTCKQSLRLYSLHLLPIFAVGIIIGTLGVQDSNANPDFFTELSPWWLFALTVVILPTVEEIIFRLPLRPKAVNLALPASIIFCLIVIAAGITMPALGLTIAALTALNFYLWRSPPKLKALENFYRRYPRIIFYLSTVLFGAIHITNYEQDVWQLLPILVLPQTILALWMGFLRLRYGFLWAVLGHGLHNGFVLTPLIVVKIFGSPEMQERWFSNPGAVDNLPMRDQLLVVGSGLFILGGLIVGAIAAWKTISEWRRHQNIIRNGK